MLRNIQAVFFDMDGTLFNSNHIPHIIDKSFFKLYNMEVPEGLGQKLYGMSLFQSCQYFTTIGVPGTAKEIHKNWMSLAVQIYLKEAKLKKGADRLVTNIHNRGFKTAIVTSNDPLIAETLSNSYKIRKYFDAICSSNEVEKAKPEPDVYLHAAKILGVDPTKCLTFEDTLSGIMSGKKAGMKVCAIYDFKSVPQDDEKRRIADFYIHDFDEVIDNTYEILQHK